MADLPAPNYISDNTRDEGELKAALEALRDVVAQGPGQAAAATLTIASGAIDPVSWIHPVDTQGAASSDNLDNITQADLPDGSLLFVFPADAARTVVVRHNQGGVGEILTLDGLNFSMENLDRAMLLRRAGNAWREMYRVGPRGAFEIGTSPAPSFAGSWSHVGGNEVRYDLGADGWLRMWGTAKHTGDPGASSLIFTLAADHRPAAGRTANAIVPCTASTTNGFAWLEVDGTSGTVTFYVITTYAAPFWVYFDGVQFPIGL